MVYSQSERGTSVLDLDVIFNCADAFIREGENSCTLMSVSTRII